MNTRSRLYGMRSAPRRYSPMGMTSARSRLMGAQDPYDFPTNWKYNKKSEKSKKELQMWREWDESGRDPEKLDPLMNSLKPIRNKHVNRYASANVHRPAMEARADQLMIKSLESYDPTRAQLNTHMEGNLRSLDRYTKKRQNFSRVTESRLSIVGDYNRAKAELRDDLNREPTSVEIADHLKISRKQVEKLELELKSDQIGSMVPETQDAFVSDDALDKEVADLLYTTLTPEEQLVWEYMTGTGGKPQINKGSDIAKRLGWSNAKVSQRKKSIEQKYQMYTTRLR